jgi:hypothetical protein
MLYSRKKVLFGLTPIEPVPPIRINVGVLRRLSSARVGQTVLRSENEWQIDCDTCYTAFGSDMSQRSGCRRAEDFLYFREGGLASKSALHVLAFLKN